MNFRKNSVLIVGGGVAALLLAGMIVFLVMSLGAYRENQSALTSARNRLEALNNRNPFPSSGNVEASVSNLAMLTNRYELLVAGLKKNQIQSVTIEPSRFAPMLEQAALRIRKKAEEAKVTLPVEPGLGFKDYAAGKLPPNDPAVLQRLVVQVNALENIIGLAIDAKVSSLDAIQRDDFELRATPVEEEQTVMRGRGRGRGGRDTMPEPAVKSFVQGVPMPPADPRYEVERFVLSVTGREGAVWDLLNRLVTSEVIYSIADVSFENTRTDTGRPVDMKSLLMTIQNEARAAAQEAAKGSTGLAPGPVVTPPEIKMEDITKESRRAGGREPVKARLVIDMYRFVDPVAVEEAP